VFGCPMYVMYNFQEREKLDPKSRKCILLDYADHVKNYRLWDPTACKVIVSRDVVLVENELQSEPKKDNTFKETAIVHMEEKFKESDSSEVELEHDEKEPNEVNSGVCRSTCQTKKPS